MGGWRKRMRGTSLAWVVPLLGVVLTLALPLRDAKAQAGMGSGRREPMKPVPLAERTRKEAGNGLRIGSGRLHPFMQAESQYQHNPGRIFGSTVGDIVLVGRPGFDFELPSNTLELKAAAAAEYRRFLGIENPRTRRLSTFAGLASVGALVNKEGKASLRLWNDFRRSADPGNQTLAERLLHNTNIAGLGVDYKPGGGALMLSLDYAFFIDVYDREDNAVLDPAALDNMRHMPKLKASWRFLPKTAAFIEAQSMITRFYNTDSLRTPDSNLILSYVGFNGAITSKVSGMVKLGYGNTLMDGPDNFSSFIGHAEVAWDATSTTKLKLGGIRNVQPTSLFGFFDMWGAYFNFGQAFGRAIIGLLAEYRYLTFGIPPDPAIGTDVRHDHNILGGLHITYNFTEWFSVRLEDRLDYRISDWMAPAGINVGYFNNIVLLRLNARY